MAKNKSILQSEKEAYKEDKEVKKDKGGITTARAKSTPKVTERPYNPQLLHVSKAEFIAIRKKQNIADKAAQEAYAKALEESEDGEESESEAEEESSTAQENVNSIKAEIKETKQLLKKTPKDAKLKTKLANLEAELNEAEEELENNG